MLDWLLRKQSWECLFYKFNSVQENVNSQSLKHSCEWNSFSGSRKTFLSWTYTAIVIHSQTGQKTLSTGWGKLSLYGSPKIRQYEMKAHWQTGNRGVFLNFRAGWGLECELMALGRGRWDRWRHSVTICISRHSQCACGRCFCSFWELCRIRAALRNMLYLGIYIYCLDFSKKVVDG